jgi:peptidoglycan/xylan/chitin deacetylase (PgdA/CDA1 family)
MSPTIGTLLRRARRSGVTSPFTLIYRLFASSPTQTRHVKIDDEERQSPQSFRAPQPRLRLLKMIVLSLLVILLVFIFLAYTVYKPPQILIRFLQWKYSSVLWHIPLPSTSRVVALTIDDAPSDQTAQILDLLKSYGAKATFFAIGSQIASHSDLIQRIHDEGHEIGNHAWRDEPSIKLPLSELERQITEVESLIPANVGEKKYFRPGSGLFNKKMVDKVKDMGYRVVLGSIYPHDPQIHDPVRNSKHVLSMLKPGGIIIMHDRRDYSAKQLELILEGMKEKDWQAQSLGGMLKYAEIVNRKKDG